MLLGWSWHKTAFTRPLCGSRGNAQALAESARHGDVPSPQKTAAFSPWTQLIPYRLEAVVEGVSTGDAVGTGMLPLGFVFRCVEVAIQCFLPQEVRADQPCTTVISVFICSNIKEL